MAGCTAAVDRENAPTASMGVANRDLFAAFARDDCADVAANGANGGADGAFGAADGAKGAANAAFGGLFKPIGAGIGRTVGTPRGGSAGTLGDFVIS